MNKELEEYFKNMFSGIDENIVLDDEQIKAILNDDKHTLILAGAGTGKTITMTAKVKYLVDIKKVNPSKILVISYTKKAVEELKYLINNEFGINANIRTFHSLAYQYIKEIFKKRTCEIIDFNEKEKIFYDYINEKFKKNEIKNIVEIFNKTKINNKNFVYGKIFEDNYFKFKDYDSFFEYYKTKKIEEANNVGINKKIDEWVNRKKNSEYIITIKGELVKSASEMIIANFLFKHGIDYKYEKLYKKIESQYKPDFVLDLAGQEVYLEYFGLTDKKYQRIKQEKIDFHKARNNKFIYIENKPINQIEQELDFKLRTAGFMYSNKTDLDIYTQILNNNKLAQIYNLKSLFYDSIEQIKENIDRDNYQYIFTKYVEGLNETEKTNCINQFKYINDFYVYYSNKLYSSDIYGFDYSDLIFYSNKYMKELNLNNLNYEYIVIDEYQDISDGEYLISKNVSEKNDSKVFAVGDDWQSIYSFRGSNINYITNFNNYFEKPTILTISNTYRNSQELIDITGEFIRENKDQINKKLFSIKHLNQPIKFIEYDDRIINEKGNIQIDESIEYKRLKELILDIHKQEPNHNILILGRNNKMIENCFKYEKDFIDDLGTKIRISNIEDLKIEGMTIHKAKGLTFDEVIIIGMNVNFPSEDFNKYWLINLYKPKRKHESIPFAEERRIFYVALTRTKNNVYVLTNKNADNRSEFVDELIKLSNNENNIKKINSML